MKNPFRQRNAFAETSFKVRGFSGQLSFDEASYETASEETLERDLHGARNLQIPGLLLGIFVIVILFRLYSLAINQHAYYRDIADGNRLRVEYLTAPRGGIYDQYGALIAGNRPSFELVISPLDLPKNELDRIGLVDKVSAVFQISKEEIMALINENLDKGFESVLVRQNIPREQALVFHERQSEMTGFRVVNAPIRDYKLPEMYSHLLGYVGKINAEEYKDKQDVGYLFNDALGKIGIEQVYEEFLRGRFGKRQVEVDAKGEIKKVFGEQIAESGNNLVLNIDADLSEQIFQSLKKRLNTLHRQKASAVAMNPQTGEILAIMSLPGFDNNKFAEGISTTDYQALTEDKDQPLFNRAVAGTYPSGSVIKPVVALAGLSEKIITENTVIDDKGVIVIHNPYGGPDYEFIGYRRKALGLIDIRKAIALSSDIFFYIISGGYDPVKISGMGINKLAEYYRKFNLGTKLGIDLTAERPGLVPDPEWKREYFGQDNPDSRWYLGDTYHVSIGQGDLLVTPLQVLSWTATIANGGKVMRPQVADQIIGQDGQVIKEHVPEVIRELEFLPSHIRAIQEGMRLAVTSGTAIALNDVPMQIAAKTGTAQFDAKDSTRSHAWFTAYAPYDDPKIAITVMIEDGGEGGINAVPVVEDALRWWAEHRLNK